MLSVSDQRYNSQRLCFESIELFALQTLTSTDQPPLVPRCLSPNANTISTDVQQSYVCVADVNIDDKLDILSAAFVRGDISSTN